MDLENVDTEKWLNLATDYGLRILAAIIIWIVGMWIIKRLLRGTKKVMAKSNYEESLQKFLLNLLSWILKILLILAILAELGVETTSFAAILAAAGLAVGMALQGSLGNFAGGVLIMIFKSNQKDLRRMYSRSISMASSKRPSLYKAFPILLCALAKSGLFFKAS